MAYKLLLVDDDKEIVDSLGPRLRREGYDVSVAFDGEEAMAKVKDHNPDVDMTFDFKCSECNLERRLDMPIGASFLWPDIDA